jgi:hypothetical protein
MFLLGAAKNFGAKALAGAVEIMLNMIRTITGRECLVPDQSLSFPPSADAAQRASWHCALVTAARAVRGCYDQLDLDARRATAILSRHLLARKRARDACSHTPDLDMVFTQAALQAGPDPALRHVCRTPAASDAHPARRRHSLPAPAMNLAPRYLRGGSLSPRTVPPSSSKPLRPLSDPHLFRSSSSCSRAALVSQ